MTQHPFAAAVERWKHDQARAKEEDEALAKLLAQEREKGRLQGLREAKKQADDGTEDENPYPDESTGEDDDRGGDDQSPTRPKDKSKKKAKPIDIGTTNDENAPPSRMDDEEAAYWSWVRTQAAAIIAAGARARGRPVPPAASKRFADDFQALDAERAAGLPVVYTAEMILRAGRRRRGEEV